MNQWNDSLDKSVGLKLGVGSNSMVQGFSGAIPGEDSGGVATTIDFMTTWELVKRDTPTTGQIFMSVEGRWAYGTTGPMDLGPASLGSLGFTANTYAAYVPTFLPIRNMYWQQGGKEAGWVYRVGRITVDQTFSTSRHISPATTYSPIAGTGPFVIALSDSGWGASGAWYFTDRIGILGAIADANGNRQDFGDIGEGDFFKAIELGFQLAPRTKDSGYSKITFWHTDGTSDGEAINGSTGPPGWGVMVKLEQELSSDGRHVGLLRYGRSFNDSAMYRQLGAVHWLLYEPGAIGHIRNDVVGVAFNWVEPTNGVRDEYNWEIFYRFPTFTGFDTTLSYQAILHPSLDLGTDFSNVVSLRLRAVF